MIKLSCLTVVRDVWRENDLFWRLPNFVATPTGLSYYTPSPLVNSSIASPMSLDFSASSVADHNPALPFFAYMVVDGRPMCKA